MSLPKDPFLLLSYINTQLRDNYSNLDELCTVLNIDKQELSKTLKSIGYIYDKAQNAFK